MKSTTPRVERSRSTRLPSAPPAISAIAQLAPDRRWLPIGKRTQGASAISASRVNPQRDALPRLMLNAAPGLYASVNRTTSPTTSCGT